MTVPRWAVQIRNGKVVFENRPLFDQYVAGLEGQRFDLILKKRLSPKADGLRRFYFKHVVDPIAYYTGHTHEQIHEEMKRLFNSYVDEYNVLIVKSVFSGQSDLSDTEKLAFINSVRDWAITTLNITTQSWGAV